MDQIYIYIYGLYWLIFVDWYEFAILLPKIDLWIARAIYTGWFELPTYRKRFLLYCTFLWCFPIENVVSYRPLPRSTMWTLWQCLKPVIVGTCALERDVMRMDMLFPPHAPHVIFLFYTIYLNPYPPNNNLKRGWDRKCLLEAVSKYTLPILLIKC